MFNSIEVRKILKSFIDKKIYNFVIYPFGSNGVHVRNILKDYFDIEPCFIVDNEYCKYKSDIVSKNVLRDNWNSNMFVILTVEEESINAEIFNELLEYMPNSNIINLYKSESVEYVDREKFLLDSFLPSYEKERTDIITDKIKVRILHSDAACWNVIDTICQAFFGDALFELSLIITSDINCNKMVDQTKKNGYGYFLWDDYQIENDRPDILILTTMYDMKIQKRANYRRWVKLVIVASLELIRYEDTVQQFWMSRDIAFRNYCPDYYLYDSLLYQEIKETSYFSDNIIEMGNAKFDGIYQAIQRKDYGEKWKKLGG